ncbi:IclR family transcriptional regulator [Virgisporangium aliadipatigenens]|uniref:Glycerol operon regulatory protein n=1 Tax=Virgisporangium aliadipatigenens TaxID=741659 RepID=A0A8J3YQ93_9ACTN|nr:IclR family transcriptional regulator [Virgisporangium aliadipatigenens]GIJ49441.1 IclR family transcriptional regulator [Virgisporangium aliadipatigenens]
MSTRREPGVSVTARLLRVFEAFTAEQPRLTLSEIARRVGLPLATAHRMIDELVRWGALERDDDARYHIGLRLWEVGALAPRGLGVRERAMPFLEDLYEATHQNVQLAVRDGVEALYVERLSGRGAVKVISRVGGRLPLHATGVGLALLAFAPADVQEQVLAGPLRAFTRKTVTSAHELRRVLATVRLEGVVIIEGGVDLDALSVAAPIFDRTDQVAAALSIVIPASEPPAPYTPVVRAAARGVSRALGAPRALRRPT